MKLLLSFAIAAMMALPAQAEGAVVGTGKARGCYEAAQKPGRLRDALRVCDGALADAALPADERAATYVNRGIIQMQARNLAAAIADYDEAIRTLPDTAEAYVNKGIALVQMGDHDDAAIAELTEGLAHNPARPAMAYYIRGIAYEQSGRLRAAYEDYGRAAQLDPDWAAPAEELQRFQVVRGKTATG